MLGDLQKWSHLAQPCTARNFQVDFKKKNNIVTSFQCNAKGS